NLKQLDPALAHASMQAMRSSGNWPAVLKLLDQPDSEPTRALALRAIAGRFEVSVVDGLIERLGTEVNANRRREYAEALTRVYKKPGTYAYWGYRPVPRPANSTNWERTEAIEKALDRVLADTDQVVRLTILRRMQREKIPARLTTLGNWLRQERTA